MTWKQPAHTKIRVGNDIEINGVVFEHLVEQGVTVRKVADIGGDDGQLYVVELGIFANEVDIARDELADGSTVEEIDESQVPA